MKKVFSLILAVVMVASLASVAFAVDNFDYLTSKVKDVRCYGYINDWYSLSEGVLTKTNTFVFGKTYYMPIIANSNTNLAANANDGVYKSIHYATFAKQIGSLKAVANLTEGAEFIKSVDIVPIFVLKDCNAAGVVGEGQEIKRNIYAIAITTQGEATKSKNIVGEIVVTGKAGSGAADFAKKIETKIPVDTSVYYSKTGIKVATNSTLLPLTRVSDKKFTNEEVDFTGTKYTAVSFNNDIKATADDTLSGKYLVSFNTIEDAAVAAANPDAAIMCYNITFNFRQDVEIEINPIDEEGTNYLYQKLPSGAVKDLTSTYVEDDGLFEFTARKLTGTYYVSDMPLVF